MYIFLASFYRTFLNIFLRIKGNFSEIIQVFVLNRETKNIFKKLDNGLIKRVFIVYDNNISPPAHGDFMNIFMLAKWFSTNKIETHLIVIEQSFGCSFWVNNSIGLIKAFLQFQIDIIKFWAPNTNFYSKNISWDSFLDLKSGLGKSDYILFEKKVLNRSMIVNYAFNLINKLTPYGSKLIKDNWRLGKRTEYKSIFETPYIALNIRKSEVHFTWNNSESQIIEIYRYLKFNFPELKIVVLSDLIGTNFTKEIANRHKLDLIFSKDYSNNNSYMDDANIILNSSFYFQFSGGGMSTVAFFSNIPYLILQKPGYENLAFKNGLNWAKKNQKFIPLEDWSPSNVKEILSRVDIDYLKNSF